MTKPKAELSEIRLEPMKGGVVSHTTMKHKRSGQGGGPDHDYETVKESHPTMDSLHAHLQKTIGPHFGSTADGEQQPDKGED